MSLFSDEIRNLITSINTSMGGLKFLGVDILLAKNSLGSQAALLSLLDSVQDNPKLYWHIVNGLAAQQAIDARIYYEAILLQHSRPTNRVLQEITLHHIHVLDRPLIIRILSEALAYHLTKRLVTMIVSMLVEQCGTLDFYRIVLLLRQHHDRSVRHTIVGQIVYSFEADVLLPLALGMLYPDNSDFKGHDTAVIIFWHCITQNKIDGYEAQVVLALQYCLYSSPDLGVMPYRCLMEIDTPEAKAALVQWDIDNKSAEVQFFR